MGEVFAGRYELVDLLGAGGMGSVWRVFDHRARCYVAAKVLRQGDASALLRFVREQGFRIHHPNVVTPRGWAGEDERVLFTMDLVRGGTLSLLLQRCGRLPPQWVAVLTDQILAALVAVHEAGLIHRDIKPGNIMLEPTGRARPVAKLMDFGVAVPVDEPRLTRASQMLGTPGYLAPEVFTGADPELRHDLYSTGVLAAEMLSGRRPDPDSGIPAAVPDGVPAPLWDYVRRLGAWLPDDRPASGVVARKALAGLGILPSDGEPPVDPSGRIEVFDIVGPLPNGWGPAGPAAPRAAGAVSSPSRPGIAAAGGVTGSSGPAGSGGSVGAGSGGSRPGGPQGGAAARAGAPAGSVPMHPQVTPTRGVTPVRTPGLPPHQAQGGAERGSGSGNDRGSRRRWPLAVASAALVVAGLVLGSSVWWADPWLGSGGPGGEQTPAPRSTASDPAAPLDPAAKVGGPCDFTEVGSPARTTAGEVVVCRKQPDRSYIWVAS